MILVDPREGSKEILDYITAIPAHPPVEYQQMEYGDVALTGNGPNGTMFLGFEVKSIGDALNCIETGRFVGHQLPGLKATYDVVYLLIFGEWRSEWQTGTLQLKIDKGKGGFWVDAKRGGGKSWTHYEFSSWLAMVELGWGIRSRRMLDHREIARTLVEMWKVLQKPWEEHKTLNPFYLGPQEGPTSFVKPTLVERVVAQIDGIGPAKAREIGQRFPTVAKLLLSGAINKTKVDVANWKGIPGVGKQTAEKIIRLMWEGEHES